MGYGKTRVAVLGGGVGALTAAYELTRPERAGAYEVTVYALGWRLGGKGASSRNPDAHQRIEEHGLHLWMGCYENAFRVIRDCYEALGRAPGTPLATWEDAFRPRDTTVLQEHHDGAWTPWPQTFPVLDSRPGESDGIAGPWEMVTGLLRWGVSTLFGAHDDLRWTPSAAACRSAEPKLASGGIVSRDLLFGTAGARLISGLVEDVEKHIEEAWNAQASQLLPGLIAGVRRSLVTLRWVLRRALAKRLDEPDIRRAFLTADYVFTNALGILTDNLLLAPDGTLASYGQWLDNLERIDDLGYRDWLRGHGAHAATVDSCIVRGLGDAVFNSGARGSAGTALNGLIRLNLTYRGSVFYQMQAGMGETVFTPLYEVLKRQGVKFEFFHRVDALHLDASRRRIESFDVTRQVALKGEAYDPLVDVDLPNGKLACWPTEPKWEALVDGERLRAEGVDLESPAPVAGEQTRRVADFDQVVLGIPVGALRPITQELVANRPAWGAMLDRLGTTATQSVQLWFDRTAREMGWDHPGAVCTAYADPLDTWADMTHLLEVEDWGAGAKHCTYLVGSLQAEPGVDPHETSRATARRWLAAEFGHLLPQAMKGGDLDWDKLCAPDDLEGEARLDAQYIRANTRPSDLYVLSLPGTVRYRMRPHRSGFENLVLAGDWTKTGLNVGSVEAATMSGLRAASGITGGDVLIVGDYED